MPDDPKPQPVAPPKPSPPADPAVYGGRWGGGDKASPPGQPPLDRPDKIERSPDTPSETSPDKG